MTQLGDSLVSALGALLLVLVGLVCHGNASTTSGGRRSQGKEHAVVRLLETVEIGRGVVADVLGDETLVQAGDAGQLGRVAKQGGDESLSRLVVREATQHGMNNELAVLCGDVVTSVGVALLDAVHDLLRAAGKHIECLAWRKAKIEELIPGVVAGDGLGIFSGGLLGGAFDNVEPALEAKVGNDLELPGGEAADLESSKLGK